MSKDLLPTKSETELSLPETWLDNEQLLHILQRTPKNHKMKRPGKGGGEFEYVSGVYMKKVLNYVFGWNWDFEIVDAERVNVEKGKGWGHIIVQGRLTVRSQDGEHKIVKMQYGRADVKYYKSDPKRPVDLGNDMKSAATDALKKCASELGIASDVYGAEEFREVKTEQKEKRAEDAKKPPSQKSQIIMLVKEATDGNADNLEKTVKELTNLKLTEKNFEEIINRLTVLVEEDGEEENNEN